MAALESRFEAARRRCGTDEVRLRIAEREVTLSFAGPAMREALAGPFSHLAAEGGGDAPWLRIEIWDGESSGVEPPPLPWGPGDLRELGEVEGFNDGAIRTICDVAYGAITVVDQERGKALFQVPAAGRVPWYERASPLRAALHHLLAPTGAMLIHAGAVGTPDAGALLVGRGGSGKSTLATAAALRGLGFAGDDYVALTLDRGPVAHSVHCTAKLSAASLELLPELPSAPAPPEDPDVKAVFDLGRALPGSLRTSLPLRAIVVPRLAPGPPRWNRIGGAEALRALAPSTMLQLPVTRGAGMAQMAALARSVPSYALELGDDPRAAVTALEEVLADAV